MTTIVIADDSGTARMMIRRCLEIIGYAEATFFEAENGKEALTLVKQHPVDILLTDLNMPVMDGETLLKWVKASPRLNEIPVLIITSAGNQAKTDQLMAMGAFAVANKPINPAILSKILAPLCADKKG